MGKTYCATWLASAALIGGMTASASSTALACGGMMCSTQPIDQSGERIVFTVHEDEGTTDMVAQITYAGDDDDFVWVLPLLEVPEPESLATVPLSSLLALDAGSRPTFQRHPDCPGPSFGGGGDGIGCGADAATTAFSAADRSADAGVEVFFEAEVGPYRAVAISSSDPDALVSWLQDNAYNIAPSMEPYIDLYTREGLRFLVLRLNDESSTNDIQPFKLSLPGTSPSIPLRLTTIAAEPEMQLKVWVFGEQRYEPANATEVSIDPEELRWRGTNAGITNYEALVARAVDANEGRAWVVEMADDTDTFLNLAIAQLGFNVPVIQVPGAPETVTPEDALREMLSGTSYGTRFYTRMAPGEMIYDPAFRRSKRGDVDPAIELPFVSQLCRDDPEEVHPCHFATCGELGMCRKVLGGAGPEAACACAPGTSARETTGPFNARAISCQEERLSFLNPGERMREDAAPLGDPCSGVECGEHGACVAVNLTPTCECEEGFVAMLATSTGAPPTCVLPVEEVPKAFYGLRPRERAADLPVGIDVPLAKPSDDMSEAEIRALVADEASLALDDGGSSGRGCRARLSRSQARWALPLMLVACFWPRRRRA